MKKRFKRIYIEITNVCNLSCSFCPETKREKKFMTKEEFLHIIKEIKLYTDYIYFHIKGEPLMHPNLKEFLDICDDYNLKVNITTNGTLLLNKKDILMRAKALRQINISLHSTNNYKEMILVAKEISEKTNINIQYRLWNLKNNQINVNTKVIKELEDIFNINIVQINEKARIKLSNNCYLHFDYEFIWPDINEEIISENGTCLGLRDQVGILSDGTVVPCCLDNDGIINLGNIIKESFESILESKKVNDIIINFQNNKLCEELCTKCGYANPK